MVLDGRALAQTITARLRHMTEQRDVPLELAAVLVGDDPGLRKFVELKKKAAEDIGVQFSLYAFNEQAAQREVVDDIAWLSSDNTVQGILVELPLPEGFDLDAVMSAIAPEKDVDVLSPEAQENYYKGRSPILPPAVRALQAVLEHQHIDPKGKKTAVFGSGTLVGKPTAHWLKGQGANVSIIDEFTEHPERLSRVADIVVSGVGKPGLITADMVKDGAAVIDFGYAKKDGRMAGDVDFDSVFPKAGLITPVPGGMGPIVIAAVLENLVTLAK